MRVYLFRRYYLMTLLYLFVVTKINSIIMLSIELQTEGITVRAPSVGVGAGGDVCAACIASPQGGDSTSIPLPTSHTYEKFLEATGLSQKSILTPTRVFSNHRSF